MDYDLHWPNGISLDYHNRRLYWVDAGTDKIEYYDLNKQTRNRLPKAGSPHAFGISILGEMVYWTDWQKRSLYQFNRETNKLEEVIWVVSKIIFYVMHKCIYHISLKIFSGKRGKLFSVSILMGFLCWTYCCPLFKIIVSFKLYVRLWIMFLR